MVSVTSISVVPALNTTVYSFLFNNTVYRLGEYDENDNDENSLTINVASPDIYQPRRNRVYSYGMTGDIIDLDDLDSRADHIKHMRDSVERLKIMSILLAKQADELEQTGKITTSMYYPEPEND